MKRRGPLGVLACALVLTLTGCAAVPATRVARSPARPSATRALVAPHALASAGASSAAAARAAADASREVTLASVPSSETAAMLGTPLKRAGFPTKKVALTLDDGPSKNLADVVDIFERNDARCTFFWVGNRVARYEHDAKRAAEAGFEIENHSWDHFEIKGETKQHDLWTIDKTQARLEQLTGRKPVFMRPPAGHWDQAGLDAVTERGLVMALWSVHGQDTGPGTESGRIARGVIASARGGDIILLHETNPETVRALPAIIKGLRKKGLEPVTLAELLRH